MTQQKKKAFVLTGAVMVAAAFFIFGGQFLANKIAAEKAANQALSVAAVQTPNKSEPVTVEPIMEATVYDETGAVAIEPTPEDKAEAEANAAAQAQPEVTKTETSRTTAASTETQKTETPKPTSTPKSTEKTQAAPKTESKPKTTTDTTTPKADTSTSTDSSSHDGQVYVEGFGWIDSGGENQQIQMEDAGGGWNKMVGE